MPMMTNTKVPTIVLLFKELTFAISSPLGRVKAIDQSVPFTGAYVSIFEAPL